MSFGSTITVTVNSVAKVLYRVNASEPFSSVYQLREATGMYELNIRHSLAKPNKDGVEYESHYLQLRKIIFAVGATAEYEFSASTVLRCPRNTDYVAVSYVTAAQVDYLDTAGVQTDLLAWLS